MKRTPLFIRLIFALSFFGLTSCGAPQPTLAIPEAPPPVRHVVKKPRVALVLGAGGVRGFAHIGVLKVLHKAHIPVDIIAGSSAGSIVGSVYADNLNPVQTEKILLAAKKSQVLDVSVAHLFAGPVTGHGLQDYLVANMQAKNFRDLKIPFIAVTTDLTTGKVFPIASGPIAPAVNASSAVTPVFHPVKLYGKTLVDGGFVEPVPVEAVEKFHPRLIIAVNVEPAPQKKLPKTALGNFARSFHIAQIELAKLEQEKADIVIRPDVGSIGTFDADARPKAIAAGEKATLRMLPQIKRALRRRNINQ